MYDDYYLSCLFGTFLCFFLKLKIHVFGISGKTHLYFHNSYDYNLKQSDNARPFGDFRWFNSKAFKEARTLLKNLLV